MRDPIHIAGIGSYQGADRVGWQLIDQLSKSGFVNKFPEHQITLACLDAPGLTTLPLGEFGLLLLIDAVIAEPGVVIAIHDKSELTENIRLSSHGFGLSEAWNLIETLAVRPPRIAVFGIGIGASNCAPSMEIAEDFLKSTFSRLEQTLVEEIQNRK